MKTVIIYDNYGLIEISVLIGTRHLTIDPTEEGIDKYLNKLQSSKA